MLKLERDPELLYHGGFVLAAAELDQIYQSFPGFWTRPASRCPIQSSATAASRPSCRSPGQPVTLEALHAFLHEQGVAPYKYPDGLVVVSTIPRDGLQCAVLRDQLMREV